MTTSEPGGKPPDNNKKQDMSYSDYLCLDQILSAQSPQSQAHDEMLFIVQHQTSELWMRLAIHELEAAREALASGEFPQAFKFLARVTRIFEQLNNAWDVLRTMTPSEYTDFRQSLGSSSGFQSWQYRLIEFVLGNRNTAMLKVHEHTPSVHQKLHTELQQKSLYHIALEQLGRHLKFSVDDTLFKKESSHEANEAVIDAWAQIYQNPRDNWQLYELAEELVDLEDYFRRWRFNHVTTVERIIGFKRGTGGTSGVKYLRQMLDVELFPELWQVRGRL